MKNPSSSSIKSTGDKNVTPGTTKMSPRDLAETVVGKVDVSRLFGKAPLLAIVHRGSEMNGLGDFAFRVLMLFAVKSVADDNIVLSHTEIAAAMSCSERQAQRAVAELEHSKYVIVSRKHNCRNAYELNDPFSDISAKPGLRQCSHCQRSVKLKSISPAGWCYACVDAAELTRQIQGAKAILGDGATIRDVAHHIGLEKQERRLLKALRRMGVAA